jgi:hypothetical protein
LKHLRLSPGVPPEPSQRLWSASSHRPWFSLAAAAILPVALCAPAALAQAAPPSSTPPPAAPTQTDQAGRPLPPAPTIDTNVNQNQTLANVRYDNRWEVYGAPAFKHFSAGPNLVSGSNLGGFDVQLTRWLRPRLGITGNARGYYGTNAAAPNPYNIHGPFVMEHLFLGGATYRVRQNHIAALSVHGLAGFGYGDFQHALGGVPPVNVGFFSNGGTFALAAGGALDLNRSPHLALRISPDYVLTRYGGFSQNEFALSVGILYRFDHFHRPHLPRSK